MTPRAVRLCGLGLAALLAAAGCAASPAAGGPGPSSSPTRAGTGPGSTSAPATTTPSPAANPAGLTDRELVGQLFTTYVYGSGARTVTADQRAANLALYGEPTPAAVVARWHLGGILLIDHNNLDPARPDLSTGNVATPDQIRGLVHGLQAVARRDSGQDLLVSVDQEGGIVQRIKDGVDPVASQADTATGTLSAARCTYYRLGRQLRALGVNQDYAPVADVIREPQDVIGTRSFGTDPARDAAFVRAAVTGLQSAGVLATVKHWPGHGNTVTDSHAALAVLHQDAATWRRVDRRPFATAAGEVAAVMVGHLALPALDPSMRPATLSPVLVRGQLRKLLGFRGLVVTDSMWMQPVRAAGDPAQAAMLALRAGDDMLLMSPDVPSASRALLARVQRSPRVRAMVQAAVRYVLAAKARIGNPPGPDLCSS